jgi:hypothetical protein
VGIASAWSASFWILFIPAFWYAGKPINFGVMPILGAVWKYMLASLIAGLASFAILRGLSFTLAPGLWDVFLRLLSTSLLFLVLYLGAVILLHGGPSPLYRFARLIPEMLPGRRFRGSSASSDAVAVPDSKSPEPVAPQEMKVP